MNVSTQKLPAYGFLQNSHVQIGTDRGQIFHGYTHTLGRPTFDAILKKTRLKLFSDKLIGNEVKIDDIGEIE